IEVRRVASRDEAKAMNEIFVKRDMVPSDAGHIWDERDSHTVIYLIAVDKRTGDVLGTVTGIDHVEAFGDAEGGSSLWCLAVDPSAMQPGIGEALVVELARHFEERGREFLDLSVIHDNEQAKNLYEKLGFERVQLFSLKNKNAYNEEYFIGPALEENLNPYARIIVDEARSRGISVDVLDESEGYCRLSRGGKSITCRESLSELTSAIAMSRCQDKYVTHRWLSKAGLETPSFQLAGDDGDNAAFLQQHGRIVVKPAVGEQGRGITVGVDDAAALRDAIALAERYSDRVLLESFHRGQDLRVIVINREVVAAAVRRPAEIVGNGKLTARTLIEKQSRRRSASTGGESQIPIDDETIRCLADAGFELEDVPPPGRKIVVRRTANLHTGGTIHDVTPSLNPELARVCRVAAECLEIPVVGLDLLVEAPERSDYVIIEANERPGLANHEPQPTAQRFVDLLFPLSIASKRSEAS
ncbi:MAG: N-acetylglutaminylglutamine synthetase, partial [Gammaproteobacteria bacterium]|nr:N-acetylglutaminylglutamine synthetase [Gammaproteobacteria bacterium]